MAVRIPIPSTSENRWKLPVMTPLVLPLAGFLPFSTSLVLHNHL